MIGSLILVFGCASAVFAAAPPYVQSNEAFTSVKLYISELLESRDEQPMMRNLDDRKHFSFSILAGAIGGLVKAAQNTSGYDALEVLDKYVPYVWKNYETVARKGKYLLNEISQKITLITDLIIHLCGDVNIDVCNAMVDERVKRAPEIYELAADILLAVGKVSQVVRQNRSKIDSIIESSHEIPFLLHNAETDKFKEVILLLRKAYVKLNEIHFRKFLNFVFVE